MATNYKTERRTELTQASHRFGMSVRAILLLGAGRVMTEQNDAGLTS
jgi:hypothetical protein